VPEISRFLGIVISMVSVQTPCRFAIHGTWIPAFLAGMTGGSERLLSMYFSEHNPPHFHVCYNELRGVVDIRYGNRLDGNLPARVKGLVAEWAEIHRDALLEMSNTKQFRKLPPLV